MQSLDDSLAETALARLFVGRRPSSEVAWFSLPAGRSLYGSGDTADTLYFLRAGRLGVIRREEGQEQQFLGVIRPGEPVGEMALVAGTPHTASVIAMRDSEVLALPGSAFFAEARRNPEIMAEVARLMIVRARERRAPAGDPTVFALVGVAPGVEIRKLADRIQAQITELGFSSTVVGAEGLNAPTQWFSSVEQGHDVVLYAAEFGESAWAQLCGRQVDRIILVGRGDAEPSAAPTAFAAEAMRQNRLIDLVLIQPEDCVRPRGSDAWLDAAPASRLFHLRAGSDQDEARLARVITGSSVGLVLSGGGARAYAHIGAVRALREAGVPLDFVGGTSMGGIVAAGVAMGWTDDEIEARIRKAFVESGPLTDIAFPMIAMTRGEKVRQRLQEHFGDTEISDLWLPYFCVSSNLTAGAPYIHKRGSLTWALRASSALPGVLPPIAEGDNILVDGAVMRNFPADVMRTRHSGSIIGVDVSRARGLTAEDIRPPASLLQWVLSGEWLHGPPIVSLLMRAATVSTERDLQAAREATDVLITPKLDKIEIRDWRAFEPAVEAGYQATKAALEKLDKPVTQLRRAAHAHDHHPLVMAKI